MENKKIGQKYKRKSDGKECGQITNLSKNSVELYLYKTSEKGINCKQWFHIQEFNKTFMKSTKK